MTLWPPVFNTALPRTWFSSTGHKDIPRSYQYFRAFLAIYNPLFGLRIFKLGLEVGNDEYIILFITGSRSTSGFLSFSMSGFSSRRKPKKNDRSE